MQELGSAQDCIKSYEHNFMKFTIDTNFEWNDPLEGNLKYNLNYTERIWSAFLCIQTHVNISTYNNLLNDSECFSFRRSHMEWRVWL